MVDFSSAFSKPLNFNVGSVYGSSAPSIVSPLPSPIDYSGSFRAPSSFSPSSQYQREPSFWDKLGSDLEDPIRKIGYALGHRVTAGEFPSAENAGMSQQEGLKKNDRSDAANKLLDSIIQDILEGKKPSDKEKSDGVSPLMGAAAQGIAAFSGEMPGF